jgi:two-component system NtrC family response regulator
MANPKILVIDDEEAMCETLETILAFEDYDVTTSGDAREGLKIVERDTVNLIISDVRLPGMSGIEFLTAIKAGHPSIPVVMISAYGDMKSAVDAMKRGAFDYLAKPFQPEELLVTVKKALDYENLMLENMMLKNEMGSRYNLADMIGESEPMRQLKDTVARVAPTDATVFIEGECGVGKELVAHSLHYHSDRVGKPFIEVNCAAFTESLLESELFGYEEGAFTGADRRTAGKFEIADGGTLYLDEIGDMSSTVQAKVLRGIQEKVFFRVGGSASVHTDVRIIAATNKDLKAQIELGNFREDLFFRPNVINIKIPPLRERGPDIVLLAQTFLRQFKGKFSDRDDIELTDKKEIQLSKYAWPGNVRELKNLMERVVILSDCEEIDYLIRGASVSTDFSMFSDMLLKESVEAFKKVAITNALEQSKWRLNRAAERLGISRHALRYQMETLGIDMDE